MIKIGTALFEACEELERERGISKEVLIASLCDAMVAAYKKHMRIKEADNIEAILDEQSGEIGVFSTKLVVDDVEDEDTQITLAEAKEIAEDVEVTKLRLKLLLNNLDVLLLNLQNKLLHNVSEKLKETWYCKSSWTKKEL